MTSRSISLMLQQSPVIWSLLTRLCAGKTGKEQRVQVSYGEGLASRAGPESCAAYREVRGEVLTRVCAG